MSQEIKPEIKCEKHPEAGMHFGQVTKTWRCNYCNCALKIPKEKKVK